jgi:hypothetical protein
MSKTCLVIQAKTWTKDAKDLYDYEASGHIEQIFQVTSTTCLKQDQSSLSIQMESSISPSTLIKIYELDNEFVISPSHTQPIYLPLSQTKQNLNKGLKLCEGDILKLGLITLKVKKIQTISVENSEKVITLDAEESLKSDPSCRICFTSNTSNVNPLISLCSCQGSVSLTHLHCLKTWIMSKATKKINTFSTSFIWDKLECEICKDKLPFSFIYQGISFDLISLSLPQKPFLLMEERRLKTFPYILHLVTPQGSPISVGRGVDNDVVINHSSVSRDHVLIELGEDFYVRDLNSKFGTLALVTKSLVVGRNDVLPIQVGKTLLMISAKMYDDRFCLRFCRNRSRVKSTLTRSGTFNRFEE